MANKKNTEATQDTQWWPMPSVVPAEYNQVGPPIGTYLNVPYYFYSNGGAILPSFSICYLGEGQFALLFNWWDTGNTFCILLNINTNNNPYNNSNKIYPANWIFTNSGWYFTDNPPSYNGTYSPTLYCVAAGNYIYTAIYNVPEIPGIVAPIIVYSNYLNAGQNPPAYGTFNVPSSCYDSDTLIYFFSAPTNQPNQISILAFHSNGEIWETIISDFDSTTGEPQNLPSPNIYATGMSSIVPLIYTNTDASAANLTINQYINIGKCPTLYTLDGLYLLMCDSANNTIYFGSPSTIPPYQVSNIIPQADFIRRISRVLVTNSLGTNTYNVFAFEAGLPGETPAPQPAIYGNNIVVGGSTTPFIINFPDDGNNINILSNIALTPDGSILCALAGNISSIGYLNASFLYFYNATATSAELITCIPLGPGLINLWGTTAPLLEIYENEGSYTVVLISDGAISKIQCNLTISNISIVTPTNNSPIFSGQTLNLSVPAITNATYFWIGPNNFTSTDQNPSISNAQTNNSGTYMVTISVSGSAVAGGSTVVTVYQGIAPPVATSNSPICSGQTLNLYTPTVDGATYSWNGPNNFSSTEQNPIIPDAQTADSGTYSVTVNVSGDLSAPGSTVAVVNPLPAEPTVFVTQPTAILATGTVTVVTPTTSPATKYTLAGTNPVVPATSNSSGIFPNLAPGIYSVTTQNASGCASAPVTNITVAAYLTSSQIAAILGSTIGVSAIAALGIGFVRYILQQGGTSALEAIQDADLTQPTYKVPFGSLTSSDPPVEYKLKYPADTDIRGVKPQKNIQEYEYGVPRGDDPKPNALYGLQVEQASDEWKFNVSNIEDGTGFFMPYADATMTTVELTHENLRNNDGMLSTAKVDFCAIIIRVASNGRIYMSHVNAVPNTTRTNPGNRLVKMTENYLDLCEQLTKEGDFSTVISRAQLPGINLSLSRCFFSIWVTEAGTNNPVIHIQYPAVGGITCHVQALLPTTPNASPTFISDPSFDSGLPANPNGFPAGFNGIYTNPGVSHPVIVQPLSESQIYWQAYNKPGWTLTLPNGSAPGSQPPFLNVGQTCPHYRRYPQAAVTYENGTIATIQGPKWLRTKF